jgi:AcrR family transcriptional regulator
MEDIAIAAGVSRARVYSYFGSKERLLQELSDHMIEDWWDVGERAMAESSSFAEALATWIRNNLTDSRRRAALSALLNEEAWVFVTNWEEASRLALRRWHTKLVELLRRGIEAGEFRENLDVESTADVMRAMQAGLIDHLVKARPSIDVSSERHVAAAIEIMVESVRRRGGSH